jgi:hypothetical protein
MDIEGVREALHRNPFEPFAIRLADGRSLPVHYRDFIALGKRRIVVIGDDDAWSIVEPLSIVSLDALPKSKSGRNGGGSMRRGA